MGKIKKQRLRSGFTTGAAAAAAAKAALQGIVDRHPPGSVEVAFLSEGSVVIPVRSFEALGDRSARSTVIKDAGDDPDVTHKAEIGAVVRWTPTSTAEADSDAIRIRGGRGVGRVTKPGLEVSPGNAAINPGPMKMIRREIREVLSARNLSGRVDVEIFVPEGERLARNTLNARLGIVGGISILGTTGVVRPMSHDAYESTIRSHLSVAGAMGLSRVVFTTGRRSERFAQELFTDVPEEGFVQIGDFFKAAMTMAAEAGINGVILTVFFGKAVKMASGFPHTHAAKSSLTLDHLAQWAGDVDGGRSLSEAIRSANTARHAFDIVNGRCNGIIREVGRRMTASAERFADGAVSVSGVILDYSGEVCFDSRRPR